LCGGTLNRQLVGVEAYAGRALAIETFYSEDRVGRIDATILVRRSLP
jgi:hypothetical protein